MVKTTQGNDFDKSREVKLYVEGGGDKNTSLSTECRKGFRLFLEKAGLGGRMPRIVACGGRRDAYESFCIAVKKGDCAYLLVDSESPVDSICQQGTPKAWLPWDHLKQRDSWEMPVESTAEQCHLMAQCMESWLIADSKQLSIFFGQGFKINSLPSAGNSVEGIDKSKVYQALGKATLDCKTKSPYKKGEHSFKLLGLIDVTIVMNKCPWAKRFIDTLKQQ